MGVGPMMIERCDSLVETREISLHKTIRTYRPSLILYTIKDRQKVTN